MIIPATKDDRSMKNLIELGSMGHFPLFGHDWTNEIKNIKRSRLNGKQKERVKKIMRSLLEHKTLAKKRIAVEALVEADKLLLQIAFLYLIETKIMDKGVELH